MSQTETTTPDPDGPYRPQPGPWQPTARPITVRFKPCCRRVLVRERCDCRAMRRQLRRAPVIWVTAGRAAA
ncbi:hypothetical protein [Micromonospora sp. NBRC 101691]|uniref:hypothetical protein n=1 Tax=Micromonospora sp. NBRC 101691 TaxID=3032198 RepID=UPI0024A0F067|nr:hypothetical protein [Micromonospora sp. NBRC 101691]GLY21660.1 hypothetical protein Misp04_13920 [Micromonospora sp. NBRC 101691]